jgi:hypothetical protein
MYRTWYRTQKKRTSNYIIIHFTIPVNYFIVYTPALSLVPPFVIPNNNEDTGSITPFGAEQKANVIVTRVKIMIKFCVVQNVVHIYNLVGKFNLLTDFWEKFSLLFAFC